MNLIQIMQDVRDKIVSSSLAGIEARLDCICDKLDGLGQGDGQGPTLIYEPDPGAFPELPVLGEDDLPTTLPGNQCQSAYAAVVYARDILNRFGGLLDIGGLNLQEVYIVLATSLGGIGAIALVIGGSIGAVFAACLAIFAFAGYGAGLFLREQADMMPDDGLVCAFINHTTPADVRAAIVERLGQLGLSSLVVWLLSEAFTEILVEQLQKHIAFSDEVGDSVPLDFSEYPSTCACVERYGILHEFRGFHGSNDVGDCGHDDFEAWLTFNDETLGPEQRFALGLRCSDVEEFTPLLESSGISLPYLLANGHKQAFTLDTGGDYTLYARPGRVAAFAGGSGVIRIENLDLSAHEDFNLVGPDAQDLNWFLLENYPAGNYEMTIYRTSSTFSSHLVEMYIAPGDNPEGAT